MYTILTTDESVASECISYVYILQCKVTRN